MKHNVQGNTEGIRDAVIRQLDELYQAEADAGEFLPEDLARKLAELSKRRD